MGAIRPTSYSGIVKDLFVFSPDRCDPSPATCSIFCGLPPSIDLRQSALAARVRDSLPKTGSGPP
jgi:hypothetical protein